MAVASAQVSVAATAGGTAIHAVDADGMVGQSILVRNKHASASVYLGPSGVTTGTGFELAAGEAVSIDLGINEILYGIVASGTATVHVLRSGA